MCTRLEHSAHQHEFLPHILEHWNHLIKFVIFVVLTIALYRARTSKVETGSFPTAFVVPSLLLGSAAAFHVVWQTFEFDPELKHATKHVSERPTFVLLW